MSYTVTDANGAVLALFEDKSAAEQFALVNGGVVNEDDGAIVESATLVESGPIILAG